MTMTYLAALYDNKGQTALVYYDIVIRRMLDRIGDNVSCLKFKIRKCNSEV